ncbi:tRNA pseudouridine(55) synthase TruB [Chitinispirillales bacterium ANBcel5]|uniref:tRNA pseudouridine(55) synthase TruB n=1 Tax=Cellulosispirillum alkaliphilum TaxID=3039283 RepID=UPI002A501DA2|nr:tRNA pseudouridine(55) synthase TruB [Chitinispirillales bacterium ANBcel5]
MEGFLCIDKPLGPSSFAVTATVKRALQLKKVGHCGTLDPYASGLLVLTLEESTKLLQYLPSDPKVYVFGLKFGYTTDTLDLQGKETGRNDIIPQESALFSSLPHFTGTILQTPPLFSAIKYKGKRAYKLAREGEDITLPPREVEIFSLEVLNYDRENGEALIKTSCSGGTYVRSLARDIAQSLGTIGVVSQLRRIQSGDFTIKNAIKLESIQDAQNYIIPTRRVFSDHAVTINNDHKSKLLFGKDIVLPEFESKKRDRLFAFDEGMGLVSVLKRVEGERFHPEKVFTKACR